MNTGKVKRQQLSNPDEALWRQAKSAAALEGITLTAWVEKAISKELKKKSK